MDKSDRMSSAEFNRHLIPWTQAVENAKRDDIALEVEATTFGENPRVLFVALRHAAAAGVKVVLTPKVKSEQQGRHQAGVSMSGAERHRSTDLKLPARHTAIEDDHTDREWAVFVSCLDRLSDDQVKDLAHRLDLYFTDGHEGTREEYSNILSEACWDEFECAYRNFANS